MQVYALYSSYFDFCAIWESVVDIYANRDDALMKKRILEDENKDEQQSWFIVEMCVKMNLS